MSAPTHPTSSNNGNVINHSTPVAFPSPAPVTATTPNLPFPPHLAQSDGAQTTLKREAVDGASRQLGAATSSPSPSQLDREAAGRKRKWSSLGFNEQEQDSMERTTTAFHYALAQDQLATLFPDPPTRFTSYEDAMRRLMPYHIWQTCDEELEGYDGESPARKQARETKENKEASDLLKRMTNINNRFMNLRTVDAQRPSPTVDLIYLIKESTSIIREELSAVQARLKVVNAERNVVEWQERERLQEQRKKEQELREQEERRQAALVAADTKHSQATAAPSSSTPRNINGTAAHPPPTPAHPAQSSTTPTSAQAPNPAPASGPASVGQSAPAPPGSPVAPQDTAAAAPPRGRGRPKGGGGLRAQILASTATTPTASTSAGPPANGMPNTPSPAPSQPAPQPPPGVSSSGVGHSSGPAYTPKPETADQPPAVPSTAHRPSTSASRSPNGTPPDTTHEAAAAALTNTSTSTRNPATATRATRANPGTGPSNGTPPAPPSNGPMKGPVSITVPITSVPDLLRAEVLSRDPDGASRAPATIARKAEEKKSVVLSIDLSRCNPKQLVALAKILKVDTAKNGSGGTRDAVAQVADGGGGGGAAK